MKHRVVEITADSKAAALKELYLSQIKEWPALAKGTNDLSAIKRRMINLDGQSLIIQFNPARIASVAAKVDSASIKARPCFLCAENLPTEQAGIIVGFNTVALANPMPIFKEHFTLTHPEHSVQDIAEKTSEFLEIAQELGPQYAVFFNGAKAGASAPDHYHLQSCPGDSFPLTNALKNKALKTESIAIKDGVQIQTIEFCLNKYLLLSSRDKKNLSSLLEKTITVISKHHQGGRDLINILAIYSDSAWHIVVMPREKHRSSCFFAEEPNKIMISPATVEMAGVIVTARESDFENIGPEDLRAIYDEVTLNDTAFDGIVRELQND